jgi:cyclopropane fatty-acyl-phospholipid synthase-like methyltransferase
MATYHPEIFNYANIDDAKSIILTDEGSVATEQRWQTETPYLREQLLSWCNISNHAQILDFGCGIGRMSRELIEHTDSSLWGVDISPTMRQHALNYVDSERFTALSPSALDAAVSVGMRFDLAMSVWVLQHCPDLPKEILRLAQALRPGGVLFVVDMHHRAIPTHDEGWINDGVSVHQALLKQFELVKTSAFAAPQSPSGLQNSAWIGLFQKRNETL